MKSAFLPIFFTLLVIPEVGSINLPIIGQTLKFNSKASAQFVADYVPPGGTKRTSRTKGAGSRGCDRAASPELQLLAPNDHIPTTASTHPTFYWYISVTKLPVRLTLVEPGVVKPIVDRRFIVTRPGVVGVKLPSDVPGLVVGKQYRWTVAIVCDEERPSANTYAYSWISRVAATPELKSKLAEVSNSSQNRSLVYAQAGIWYDALSSSIMNYEINNQDKLFSRLLAQAGIPGLNNQKLQPGIIVRSQ
jgi:Domain of Unknown Function (DUF928)